MSGESYENGPAARRTGVPRDLPDQEAAGGKETQEESTGSAEGLPDADEAGSGPRGSGTSGGGDLGDREPPEPEEPTD
ncbi:hypothetical protein E4198_24555 [Streptomyces sp. RKND-216]|uniref:hypothetical protein n=1 Tax=Streptomyces sp. RKND-216 TaxID=2562581 RepID=UPI00109E2D46|nr:hypothetical protein [Streptomyces sp. RKND-216]THA27405.1 hypothetical protein E4198_24555 [Streptomyces sp. RKND-216]